LRRNVNKKFMPSQEFLSNLLFYPWRISTAGVKGKGKVFSKVIIFGSLTATGNLDDRKSLPVLQTAPTLEAARRNRSV
jgi:hypothetical protein